MSQRNSTNERNLKNQVAGVSRKSAASAKPKSKAGASVRIKSTPQTPAEKRKAKKAAEKAEYARQRELRRLAASDPSTTAYMDTDEYKHWRRIWWGGLVVAVIATIISWILHSQSSSVVIAYICIGLAYASIIYSIYIDIRHIRPLRKQNMQPLSKGQIKKLEKSAKEREAAEAAAAQAKKDEKAAAKAAKAAAKKSNSGIKGANTSTSAEEK